MGFSRVRVNGDIITLDEDVRLSKTQKSNVEVIVDRIVVKDGVESRLTDSIEQALKIGEGSIYVIVDDKEEFYSEFYYSPKSKKSYPPLEPRLFSFNSPLGACQTCNGLGVSKVFEPSKYIEDERLSFEQGSLAARIFEPDRAGISTPSCLRPFLIPKCDEIFLELGTGQMKSPILL